MLPFEKTCPFHPAPFTLPPSGTFPFTLRVLRGDDIPLPPAGTFGEDDVGGDGLDTKRFTQAFEEAQGKQPLKQPLHLPHAKGCLADASSGHKFILLFLFVFQFSFLLRIKLGFFLLFSSAFIFFSIFTHGCFSFLANKYM
ncbi:MAG TPA: hypothetical protein VF352_08975 [Anaerolineales bacterium]